MIARSFRHVMRTLNQLPIRSFATARTNTPSKELRGSQVIPASLKYIDVQLGKHMKREVQLELPRTTRASQFVKCRFAPDKYFTGTLDGRISGEENLVTRVIERLDFYCRKRELQPLWIDVAAIEGLPPFVRETGKRRLRRALAKALLERGVHPQGWDLKSYTTYWASQDPLEQEDHELHANRDWVWQQLATLRGTLLIRVTNGRGLVLCSSKDIRALARSIVHSITDSTKFATTGPRKRTRPLQDGPKPWLLPIRHDGGPPPRL